MSDARALAVDVLCRIDDGAYANLLLPSVLSRSSLSAPDRRFVTDLVYGTTRMRRACDWLVDRFLLRPPDARTRAVLRLGAYQLAFLGTPAHAAVSATVAVAPGRTRGLVNAVLRKVSSSDVAFPSPAVELSYPDWIVALLSEDLGVSDATDALRAMNVVRLPTTREDGYVQDLASQWVVEFAAGLVDRGGRVLDVCAAPGGKATGLAAAGAAVVANDVRERRARLIPSVPVVVSDGTRPGFAPGSFDLVLVDAPCSGLGVLGRRPDARWRDRDVAGLAVLQRRLLASAASLARPDGGTVVYSVCTLTAAETVDVPVPAGFTALPPPGPPWRPHGHGALLLPQSAGTDGMFVAAMTRS